jgi:dTDP-glucose 4,6-dehydratase
MKRVLLTGASGFVGAHVLRHILKNTDWHVVCLTTFKHKGLQDRIKFAISGIDDDFNRVDIMLCDLSSPISPITAQKFGKIDYVINVASESHVDRSISSPTPFILNNVSLICHMLDWARYADIEKFIHISTDEIYGPYQNRHAVEWDPHLPSNPYSASKAAQEDIAYAYWRTFDIPIAITNTMNMIGETQSSEKYTPLLIKQILNNETVKIHTFGNGEIGSRFWLYARNKADAILHILNKDFAMSNDTNKLDRWNIAGDKEYNNLDWAQKVADILGVKLNYELVDSSKSRPGYDSRYALDNKKLNESGWKSPFDLDLALEQTIKWYLNNKEWLNI